MFKFILLTLFLNFVQSEMRFCGHDELVRQDKPKRFLALERDSSWSSLRVEADWSNMSKESKAKYSQYLEAAIDYYANALKVHRYLEGLNWDSNSDTYSCDLSAKDFYGKYIEADYYVLLIETFDSSQSFAARASSCAQDSATKQPIIGFIEINTAYTDDYDSRLLVAVLTHEFTHALGFSTSFFPYFIDQNGEMYGDNFYINETVRDTPTVYMITPNVVKRAREAFNCNSLPGLELETQGGSGTAYSHWNSRIAFNDLMNPQAVFTDFVYSEFTLAAFEDSSWYQPDYSYAQTINFGYKEGCNFHEKKCIINDEPISRMFCNDTHAESLCTHDYLSRGKCYLIENSAALPKEYQYYSDPNLGGNKLTDYCPIVAGNFNCRLPGCPNSDFMEEVCENCRCIEGTYSLTKNYEITHAACHKIACTDNFVEIYIGDNIIKCIKTGDMMDVPGFHGKLKCPDIEAICRVEPCLNNCFGTECSSGVCADSSLNNYSDCNLCNDIPNDCNNSDVPSNYNYSKYSGFWEILAGLGLLIIA
ncbi:hypothetical protein SteCoe_30205 [Stentor coeruleus]|uniref:Leishmanolysin-like peptidase n=1 Tax=Stentor coeruleus TaxID=5963 RepID=A0A1R2B433_9CILI|nr:hypothetical protein SteCoe_30205 [Stentor coeruleus]